MRKILLSSLIIFLFANFAIAQQEAAAVQKTTISFFDIIQASGMIGLTVWTVILTMWPFAFILGAISTFCSVQSPEGKMPFSFKCLMMTPVLYFFVGSIGVIYGILSCEEILAGQSGAAKASSLSFGISNTIYTAGFTLFGMIPYMFFILLCLSILHFRKRPNFKIKSSDKKEST